MEAADLKTPAGKGQDHVCETPSPFSHLTSTEKFHGSERGVTERAAVTSRANRAASSGGRTSSSDPTSVAMCALLAFTALADDGSAGVPARTGNALQSAPRLAPDLPELEGGGR